MRLVSKSFVTQISISYGFDSEYSNLQDRGHLIDHKNDKVPLGNRGHYRHCQEECIGVDILAKKVRGRYKLHFEGLKSDENEGG